jgi:16S rRNA processing protein RimM
MATRPITNLSDQKISTTPDDLIEVGRVLNAYGLSGSVKVQPFSPTADTLLKSKRWWLVSLANPNFVFYQVKTAKPHSGSIVVTFEKSLDRDQAEALKGQRIWVSRADFPQTQEDEYYWVDLIGCDVFTDAESSDDGTDLGDSKTMPPTEVRLNDISLPESSLTSTSSPLIEPSRSSPPTKKMGVVDEVLDHSAHAVLSVRQQTQDASGQWVDVLDAKGRVVTTLIPFVAAHVTAVDIKARTIYTNWPLDF